MTFPLLHTRTVVELKIITISVMFVYIILKDKAVFYIFCFCQQIPRMQIPVCGTDLSLLKTQILN